MTTPFSSDHNIYEVLPVAPLSQSDMRRAGLALAAAAAAVAVLAGCTSGPAEKKPAPTISASPSASTDPQAAVKAEVEAVYRKFWDAQVKAFAKADVRDTDLEKYAFDSAYAQALADVASMKIRGDAMTGAPVITPQVTAISVDQEPKKASLTDCLDVTNWKVVDAKTGAERPLPSERRKRSVFNFEARTVGGTWMITSTQPQDRSC
ncbi:hypothetical protein [Streptomyces sp. NPDC096339]|uniref:hypothetical protein n=1 Tax=Streptomyces sp. NPDC096339 TaxID=3366086 RepID=UPI00382C72CE